MQRRLDLAMGLVGDPRIIFLDEPTTGLDPRSRRTMWQIIRELVAGGVTILLTTQYLEEADELADRIALLDHGRLVAEGTSDELKRRIPGGHIRLEFASADGLDAAARTLGEATRDDEALTLQVPSDGSVTSLRALLDRLDRAVDRGRQPVGPHPRPRRRLPHPHRPTRQRQGEGASRMSTLTYAVADSATMLRRQLRHMLRYASMTLMLIGMPIVFLLLFVYVFGGTLGAGLGGPSGGRAEYLDFVVPGILLIGVAARRDRDGDLGRHGHDRGHHRPVPDHGHLPSLGADRARPRQHGPDHAQPGRRHRGRAAHRVPAQRHVRSSGSPRPVSWR